MRRDILPQLSHFHNGVASEHARFLFREALKAIHRPGTAPLAFCINERRSCKLIIIHFHTILKQHQRSCTVFCCRVHDNICSKIFMVAVNKVMQKCCQRRGIDCFVSPVVLLRECPPRSSWDSLEFHPNHFCVGINSCLNIG